MVELSLMDPSSDRIRLYTLGNSWEGRRIRLGKGSETAESSFIL